jgi:muramidase (phage lysozyme)
MISACEGAGYQTLYGGGTFDSFADHPRRSVTAGGYTSTAAGAYQILAGTWDDFCRATGTHLFYPEDQDACALWLIQRRGALQDVQDGHLASAIQKCGKEWASLPGSPYGQPTRSYAYCEQRYLACGGVLHAQGDVIEPSTHSPDIVTNAGSVPISGTNVPKSGTTMPILALLSAFGPLIAQLIPQIGGFIKSDKARGNLDAVGKIFDTITSAAGAPNLQGAVDAMSADKALLTKVTEAVVTHPDIMGVLELSPGSLDAARVADVAATQGQKPIWYSPALWITLIVVTPPVDYMVFTVINRMAAPSEQLVTQVVTGLLGILAVAAAFYYGTTYGSMKKDETIALNNLARNQ